MRTKRFSKADFDRYDKAARVRTQQHLELTGHTVEPHPDRYAQDLIATKDGASIYVECEVKMCGMVTHSHMIRCSYHNESRSSSLNLHCSTYGTSSLTVPSPSCRKT